MFFPPLLPTGPQPPSQDEPWSSSSEMSTGAISTVQAAVSDRSWTTGAINLTLRRTGHRAVVYDHPMITYGGLEKNAFRDLIESTGECP